MSSTQFTGKGCHKRKLTDHDRSEIVRLYLTPLPDGTWTGAIELGRKFGVRHPVIYRELDRAGVQRRTMREAHRGKACKPVTNLPVGDAPPCACGCADRTAWNQRKNRWNRYVAGHYRQWASYKDEAWLREQYVALRRTVEEIAAECGVGHSSVAKFMVRFGIEPRGRSESRVGRHLGERNAAWKGGVAKWEYAPGWKAIARKIRDRDKWTCQACSDQRVRWGHSLHVHHIDGDKLNNDPGNLVSLCVSCHRDAHRKGVI